MRGGPEWLVGLPKDIQIKDRRDRLMTLRLVSMATAVDPMMLAEVAPQLVELRTGLRPYFDPAKDSVVSVTETYFNGQKVREEVIANPEHPEAADIFCTWLAAQMTEGADSLDTQMFITRNRAVQRDASKLNVRAGEKIFPVMGCEDIEQWLKTRLGSARRMSEVKSLDALMLQPLDPKLVARVTQESPDEITVLGRSLSVEYCDGCTPRITLDHETITAHGWRELPDAGVKLPGGRLVEVIAPFGYYDRVSSQDIPALKRRCVSHVHKGLWDNWPIADRPVIVSPDPVDPTSIVPEILECPYGSSVINGTRLIAFGTAALNDYRYFSSIPWFEGKWFQIREEADEARARAVAKLESLRKEAVEQKQLNIARKTAEESQVLLRNVQFREGWYDLDSALRSRVDQRYYTYLPSELKELQVWTQATNALLAEVKAASKATQPAADKEDQIGPSPVAQPVSGEQVATSLGALRAKFGKKR